MSQITIPQALIDTLKSAKNVAVLTGAGVSAESNIPTFRDAQTGLWAKYRPEELATPEAFRANPKLVWEWYEWRRSLVANAEPNPGHHALVTMEEKIPEFTLITQNVDGLHHRAGSKKVVELHGNIARTLCFEDRREVTEWPETDASPPPCPYCDSWLRPGVVWFGESLPPEAIEAAAQAASSCDVFFSVGTSAVVYPAAGFVYEAMRRGAVTVEVNPQTTPQSGELTYQLQGPAGLVMPQLVEAVWGS